MSVSVVHFKKRQLKKYLNNFNSDYYSNSKEYYYKKAGELSLFYLFIYPNKNKMKIKILTLLLLTVTISNINGLCLTKYNLNLKSCGTQKLKIVFGDLENMNVLTTTVIPGIFRNFDLNEMAAENIPPTSTAETKYEAPITEITVVTTTVTNVATTTVVNVATTTAINVATTTVVNVATTTVVNVATTTAINVATTTVVNVATTTVVNVATTTAINVATTTVVNVATTTIVNVATTTAINVATTTAINVTTTTVVNVATTTVTNVATTTVVNVATTTAINVATTTVTNVATTTVTNVATTTVTNVATTTVVNVLTTTPQTTSFLQTTTTEPAPILSYVQKVIFRTLLPNGTYIIHRYLLQQSNEKSSLNAWLNQLERFNVPLKSLKSMNIYSGTYLNAIQFFYLNGDSQVFGNANNQDTSLVTPIDLEASSITQVNIESDPVIFSLKFQLYSAATSAYRWTPTMGGNRGFFSYSLNAQTFGGDNLTVESFYGSFDGDYLIEFGINFSLKKCEK